LLEKAGARILKQSSVYETEPVDYQPQPWFYNQVLEVEIACNPISLLDLVKDIEQRMKRRPVFDKGPRVIDIDILLAEKTVVQTQKLMIPHPRMSFRNFVMIPLSEIAPDLVHPLLMKRWLNWPGQPETVRPLEKLKRPPAISGLTVKLFSLISRINFN
jgi:2-amino-4-hydroxy-6-hydroxymethyldihydropteridine diphosphokinase